MCNRPIAIHVVFGSTMYPVFTGNSKIYPDYPPLLS